MIGKKHKEQNDKNAKLKTQMDNVGSIRKKCVSRQ